MAATDWMGGVAAVALAAVLGISCSSGERPFGTGEAAREPSPDGDAGVGPAARPSLTPPSVVGAARLVAAAAKFEPAGACLASPERCEGFSAQRPDRLSEHVAVYDPDRLQMLVHGGTHSVPVACAVGGPVRYESDLWVYDDPCGAWEKVASPVVRARHAGAYGDGKLWLFGGRYRAPDSTGAFTLYNDLWAYDTTSGEWTQQRFSAGAPAPRYGAKMVFDPLRGRLWLFGGSTDADGAYRPLGELWSFSLEEETWRQHTSAGAEARLLFGMDFDALRGRLVVFGGADGDAFTRGVYRGDLWTYEVDTDTWTRLAVSRSGPQSRFFPALVHLGDADAYVVFGGHDDSALGNRNDAWLFDPFASDGAEGWSAYADSATGRPAGDQLAGEARALCDFPPDFTDLDLAAPERRNSHTLVYSAACGHALLFGGKTDCGAIDDVWQFDLRRGWVERLPAAEGESCLRWRDDTSVCADLCF